MSHLTLVYMTTIPVKSRSNYFIILKGKVESNTNRFDIELKRRRGGDVPLLCSFRFNEGCVVRNHLQASGWGHEERKGVLHCFPELTFTIKINVTLDGIFVTASGGVKFHFRHRLSMDSITSLYVFGKASISSVKFY